MIDGLFFFNFRLTLALLARRHQVFPGVFVLLIQVVADLLRLDYIFEEDLYAFSELFTTLILESGNKLRLYIKFA